VAARRARRARVLGLLVAGTALWFVATGAPAWAHALVASSDPADGAVLSTAPRQVLITFTEAPDPVLSSVRVLASTGRAVTSAEAQAVPDSPRQLRVPLPTLPDGVYTVSWRTVSKVDGHVTGGSFAFGVGVTPPTRGTTGAAPGSSATSPSPLAVAGRWAFAWGLILLLGAGVVGPVAFAGLARGHRSLLVGAWLLSAAGLVAMTLAERNAIGVGLGTFLSSSTGTDIVTQAFALLAPLALVVVTLARPRWTSLVVLAAAAAGVMLVHSLFGHAGGESPAWFNVGVQWLHLLAVGVWVGGLAWLLLGIRGADSADRRAAVRRFSTIAGVALAVTAATGITRAITELDGWRPLFATSFGITLLVKAGLVAVLVALGATNRYRNMPRIEAANPGLGRVRRTAGWELAAAAAVILATGVLSELPPGSYVAAAAANRPAPTPSVTASGSDFATTTRVTLTATPGAAGPNLFEARVVDYDSGRPVQATAVSLAFTLPTRPDVGASRLDLEPQGGGVWSAQGTNLSIDGRWNVVVTVQGASGAVQVPLQVQTRLPPETITVSRQAGQPTLYTIALPGGGSLQTYVDPGTKPGPNTVHFTFFRATGDEQPIASATATETAPDGAQKNLTLLRFDQGHFAANVTLTAGKWTFRIEGTAPDGSNVSGYFTQQIGGSG
jgi:copper transport protein